MIRVYDDVLVDPMPYREAALRGTFRDIAIGADEFKGIGATPSGDLEDRFSQLEPGLSVVMTFVRKSPEGQIEPNYVHSDASMGNATGIFYLNPDPKEGDGTSFWRRDSTGEIHGEWSKDFTDWSLWHTVEARFNRLVVFPADLYHSRAIFENYGHGNEARLIQVVFAE